MAGSKKLVKDATTGRDKDIRVRYVKPETWKALAECSRLLREKYIPDTITKLIVNYKPDQDLIQQLQRRNSQLNASLLALINGRENVKKLLTDFIKYTEKFNDMTTVKARGLLKKLNSKGGVSRRR